MWDAEHPDDVSTHNQRLFHSAPLLLLHRNVRYRFMFANYVQSHHCMTVFPSSELFHNCSTDAISLHIQSHSRSELYTYMYILLHTNSIYQHHTLQYLAEVVWTNTVVSQSDCGKTMVYIIVICGLLMLYFLRRRQHELGFPGPTGLPIFGNYFSLRGKPMHEVLYDWSMQYGGAFKFSVFGKQFLVVSHPDTLHEVFVMRGKQFAGRFESYPTEVWTCNFQSLIATSNVALNKVLRRPLNSCLKMYGSGHIKIAGTLDAAVEDLLQTLKESEGDVIDPMEAIYRATTLSLYLLVIINSWKQIRKISSF